MENSNNDIVINDLCEYKEIYQEKEQQESKHGREKSTKKHKNRTNKHKESKPRHSSATEHKKRIKVSDHSEENKKIYRNDEQLKIAFCSRHDIESINQSSTKTNVLPKELMESIRKLPSEINAFISENIHNKEEAEKLKNITTLKSVSMKKSANRNKTLNNRKQKSSEQAVPECSEPESMKDKKSKITSYIHNLTSKPNGGSSDEPAKCKSFSNGKFHKISSKKCNKNQAKNSFSSKDDCKYSLRAAYIQWLLAENKFFYKVDSPSSSEIYPTTIPKRNKKDGSTRTFESKETKEGKKKKSKRHVSHSKAKKTNKEYPIENGAVTAPKHLSIKSKDSVKESEVILNEITAKKNLSAEQLHHVRWLTSVEDIVKLKSKEYITRTISLNELYNYIPTHDGDKVGKLLQLNHKGTCFNGKRNELTKTNEQNKNELTERYQAELYMTTVENEFGVFKQSFLSNVGYDTCSDKDTSESIESVSISIKKTNNVSDLCGSFNVNIFHNQEDSGSSIQLKKNAPGDGCNYESNECTNSCNYSEFSYGRDQHMPKPYLNSGSLFKGPANDLQNAQDIVQSIYYGDNFVYNNFSDENHNNYNYLPVIKNMKCYDKALSEVKLRPKHEENEHSNSSYTDDNNQKLIKSKPSLLTNPSIDQLDINDEFHQVITSKETSLYESDDKSFFNQLQNFKLHYNDSISTTYQSNEGGDSGKRKTKFFHKVKYEEKKTNKMNSQKKRSEVKDNQKKSIDNSMKSCLKYTSNDKQTDKFNLKGNVSYQDSIDNLRSMKIINSTGVQCDIQSCSSVSSNSISVVNRKRKYKTDDDETVYSNPNENVKRLIKYSESHENIFSAKKDEKQNDILVVMTELKQKVNLIQEQISLMNVKCTKCENIEVMLQKLKRDMTYKLTHAQLVMEVKNYRKKFKKSEHRSETTISVKTQNKNKKPMMMRSLSNLTKTSLGIYNPYEENHSEYYEINGKDHTEFCHTLDNLTSQVKCLTLKEEQVKEYSLGQVNSNDIGLMTDESPALCNYCCIYVKTTLDKPILPFFEKAIQCDLNCNVNEFTVKEIKNSTTENKSNLEGDCTSHCNDIFKDNKTSELKKLKKKQIKTSESISNKKRNKCLKKNETKHCVIL